MVTQRLASSTYPTLSSGLRELSATERFGGEAVSVLPPTCRRASQLLTCSARTRRFRSRSWKYLRRRRSVRAARSTHTGHAHTGRGGAMSARPPTAAVGPGDGAQRFPPPRTDERRNAESEWRLAVSHVRRGVDETEALVRQPLLVRAGRLPLHRAIEHQLRPRVQGDLRAVAVDQRHSLRAVEERPYLPTRRPHKRSEATPLGARFAYKATSR